jgi:serine-type D-Ala-D-Ala carboxypeptidase/endopeptidase
MPSTIAGFYEPDLAPLEHTAVRMDPAVLDRYVGQYELAPGVVVDISREGDRIWAQATGQSRVELFAASETKFFLKEAEVDLTFYQDESGKVTHLALHDEVRGDRNARKIR